MAAAANMLPSLLQLLLLLLPPPLLLRRVIIPQAEMLCHCMNVLMNALQEILPLEHYYIQLYFTFQEKFCILQVCLDKKRYCS